MSNQPKAFLPVLVLALVALVALGCGPGQTQTRDDQRETGADDTTTEQGESASASDWEKTLEEVVKGVVVLRVTVPRDFDTETSGSYLGTGFIVDAEKGLVLTNRHLVQPGPVVAEAVFLNHEEVPLKAIYRDPVHDFGLFQFDPEEVQFNELHEIELAPQGARVGVDVRVVGNDAGEKLSILSGTLARLDRDAPRYDSVGFNDFNTFYIQAASGTSGGSSGSPVVDIQGRAVAINAGGAFLAESSFFLPLDRVVRAVDEIRAGRPVTRGTIQTIFVHKPFDELRRLGLPLDVEKKMREANPEGVGRLVVEEIIPGGPADDKLEPGDILHTLDGKDVTTFIALDERFDGGVGETATLGIYRAGEPMQIEVTIDDLHGITPDQYIEVGDAVIHQLSYQQARNFRQPVEGLYVARSGYMLGSAGMGWGGLVRTIDGKKVETLDELWEILVALPDREPIQIRYALPFDAEQDHVAVAHVDRRWFPLQWCERDLNTGDWPCRHAPPPTATWAPDPSSVDVPVPEDDPAAALARSLVMVENDMPHYVEGVFATHYVGSGLVIDAERGLVVTDRDTVPVLLGDIKLTFGGALRVPARVRYVHPTHNFAIVSYDPAHIGDTPVEAATFDDTLLEPGDKTWLVGMDQSYNLVSAEGKVDKIKPLVLQYPDFPAFRDSNLDVVELGSSTRTLGGVLANEDGQVRALWVSYGVDVSGPLFKGLPIELVEQVAAPLRAGEEPAFRTLGVELRTMNPADARDYGLSDERLAGLRAANPDRRQVLTVNRTYAGFPAAEHLRGGDIVLAVDGEPVVSFAAIEAASQKESVQLEILRNEAEMTVTVPTVQLDGKGIEHVASWGGMLLHDEHLAIAAQRSVDVDGVYIAWVYSGSPASHFGVSPAQRIIGVNDTPVATLEEFLAQVAPLEDGDAVRLRIMDFEGLEQIVTIENDTTFWPTWTLRYDGKSWQRETP